MRGKSGRVHLADTFGAFHWSSGERGSNIRSCLLVGAGYLFAAVLLRIGVELNLLTETSWYYCVSVMAAAFVIGVAPLLIKHSIGESEIKFFKLQLCLMVVAILACGVFLVQERLLLVTWCVMALVYASLKLTPRELVLTTLILIAGYSAAVNIYFEIEGVRSNVELEWYRWAWFALIVPGLALISYRITSSKKSLADLNAKLSESVEQVTRLATIDPLTGLPNRASALSHLRELCGRTHHKFAVLQVDLDEFRKINESLGPEVGDKAIRAYSLRLRMVLQEGRQLFRVSADEFLIVSDNPNGDRKISKLCAELRTATKRPFAIAGHEIIMSASVGVATFPEDATGASALLACAEIALQEAKTLGKSREVHYSAPMGRATRTRLEIERDLPRAIAQGQFSLLYQPKINIRNRRMSGVEALIRWNHPTHGMLGADEFIPIAESNGLIHEIGAWVIQEGFRQAREWELSGMGMLRVAINVSTVQLLNDDMPRLVKNALRQSGASPSQIEFEITESTFLSNPDKARYILEEISKIGIKIAIDDFGTGYSSLAYLKTLPIDHIKVDKCFIRGLPHSADDLTITKAIIAIAHGLSMRVIAEGVEDSNQLDTLVLEGCDEYQGYFFSAPVPAESIEKQIRTGRRSAETS
ncbi:MAG: putative bifunctional diguanylate cyclase/phosphodiesterase [Burkholderiales bacterium]